MQVFGCYARVEKTLVNAIVESYLQGAPVRRVPEVVARPGIEHRSRFALPDVSSLLDRPGLGQPLSPARNESGPRTMIPGRISSIRSWFLRIWALSAVTKQTSSRIR